jgi:sialate O-acetylesterase
VLALVLCSVLRADVALAPLFRDGAVLQRDKPVPVWGRADAGERVSVTFAGQTIGTTAGPDGRWMVMLEALDASATPAELVATGKNTVTVRDVLVGEVWLLSGQSNMEWSVARSMNAQAEIAAGRHPSIRHFKVARKVSTESVAEAGGEWQSASPETVGAFSAVGYYFARDLQRRIDVPVGLVNASWGGTPVEAWMSPLALASDPAFAVVNERWDATLASYPERKTAHDEAVAKWEAERDAARAANRPFNRNRPANPAGPGSPHTPTGLFNGMVNPVVPYALRGALWYQGESNAGRHAEYHKLFAAMITHWRRHFGQGDFPFFWVQLANFTVRNDTTGQTWAFLREAQTETLALPNTGQAVIIDIGDSNDIHPTNKQEVGRRLSLLARHQVYHQPGDFSGPVFERAQREGASLRVHFTFADNGLTAGGKPLQSFEIAGPDRKFYPAKAVIERNTVVVSAPEVSEPIALRYAWSNDPGANLFNGAGLPAAPFRTDAW